MTDLITPGIDGAQLHRHLRSLPACDAVTVVLVTAPTRVPDAGWTEELRKP